MSSAILLVFHCPFSSLEGLGLALSRLPVSSLPLSVRSTRDQLDTSENVRCRLRERHVSRMTCIFSTRDPQYALEKFVKLQSGQDNGSETSAEITWPLRAHLLHQDQKKQRGDQEISIRGAHRGSTRRWDPPRWPVVHTASHSKKPNWNAET